MEQITQQPKQKLKTEDTGIMFEMAICLAYGILYDGTYKYGMEMPEKLKPRLAKLVELFPHYSHTAKKGARYYFTSLTDETKHLSAKTNKRKRGQVAPQVIGQATPKKFCEIIGIAYTNDTELKEYIQTNILTLLPIFESYTFDCPTIYYNEAQNTIRIITLNKPIEWDKYGRVWTRSWDKWNVSSRLNIIVEGKKVSLLEVEIHKKNRTTMAIRWNYENFLTTFKQHLSIIHM